MASLKAIRKRITSVKSTQKITRAMKMVAGARLTRAQQRIVALRPFANATAEVLYDVAAELTGTGDGEEYIQESKLHHPLLVRRDEKRVLFVVLSSDRGLCGGFNTNVCKEVERRWSAKREAGVDVHFATVGKKGREWIQRRGGVVVHDFQKVFDNLDLTTVKAISGWIVPRYLKAEYDAVYLVFNEFKSAITQQVQTKQLFPVRAPEGWQDTFKEFTYEPSREAVLEHLVPMYMDATLLRSLFDSQASEYGARMSAMDSATRNAKDMIGKLSLVYNRARQAGITNELMEIVSGAEALKDA